MCQVCKAATLDTAYNWAETRQSLQREPWLKNNTYYIVKENCNTNMKTFNANVDKIHPLCILLGISIYKHCFVYGRPM